MVKADFLTSLVLIALGLVVAAESWRMPRYTEFGTPIWSAPGIVPGMIGIALALMGMVLFMRSRTAHAEGRPEETGDLEDEAIDSQGWVRVALAFAFCILFAGLLVGRIPFTLATFLFVFAFSFSFDLLEERAANPTLSRLAVRGALAGGLALAASFLIATIFQDIFLVRLP